MFNLIEYGLNKAYRNRSRLLARNLFSRQSTYELPTVAVHDAFGSAELGPQILNSTQLLKEC